jgi:hypothetical protein
VLAALEMQQGRQLAAMVTIRFFPETLLLAVVAVLETKLPQELEQMAVLEVAHL